MVVPFVGATYERTSWPRDGGAGEQDAWLTQALEEIRCTRNAMLREAASRAKRERKATTTTRTDGQRDHD